MRKMLQCLMAGMLFAVSTSTLAATMSVDMYKLLKDGTEKKVGNITITETNYGLLFTPHLNDLMPGLHGFHLHEHASCAQNGSAAGGHFDPQHTGKHLGPYNDQGHLGDLPALFVNEKGETVLPVLAPRLKHLSELKNHSLMIHQGGDNYSDNPEKLGGGGERMICGKIL